MTDDPGTPSPGAQAAGTQGLLALGSKVAGYVIEEQVGAGGMAVVYRARDEVLGRLVAVKVLSPALASDEEFRTRFLRESRAVAAVDEPHIVPVYGAGEAGGVLYIATRFVADGDLARLQRAAQGPLPPAQAANLIAQVAAALDAAHAIGLVHRDVKPGNILIERVQGRPEHAYLSDFGLSKSTAAGATGLTATGRFMGTPDYCAPEQITGGAVDGRADQYSLACVAFSLLAGIVPFSHGDSLSRLFAHVNSPIPALTSLRPELPPAVNGVLARAMAKNPAERFESCTAFAQALSGSLGVGAGAFPGTSVPPQPQVPVMGQANMGYQPTIAAGGWQHPSVPPAAAAWQGQQSAPPGQFGPYPQGAGGTYPPQGPAGTFPQGAGGSYPPAGGSYPPGPGASYPQGPAGLYQQGPPGSYPPGSPTPPGAWQQWPQGPGMQPPLQRPPRKRNGLLIGGSIGAAAVVVAAVIVGVTLSGNNKPGDNTGPTHPPTTPAAGVTSPSNGNTSPSGEDHTGTAVLVGSVTAPGGALMRGAFLSADGNYIAATGPKADIYVFSAQTLKLVKTLSVGANDTADPVAFSPDDQTLYAFDDTDRKVYDLDIATGKQTVYPLPTDLTMEFTYGGGMIAAFKPDGGVAEYDLATGKLFAQLSNPGKAQVGTVLPDGDGKYLLINDTDGTSYLVDAQSKETVQTFQYTYSSANTSFPQITLDGNTVYIPGGSGAGAKLWDRTTKDYVTPTSPRWPVPDNGLTFSGDSRYVLSSPSSASVTVDIWNIASKAHVITVTVAGSANNAIMGLGPSGGEILTTSGLDMTKGTFDKLNIFSVPG